MLAPFWVAAIVSARNARLFDESSQASPVSSNASAQYVFSSLTASIVSFELTATLPLASISEPPYDHISGLVKKTGSPTLWPSDSPRGCPLALSFLPVSKYSSQVAGNLSTPTSLNQDLRQCTTVPMNSVGMPRYLPPTFE